MEPRRAALAAYDRPHISTEGIRAALDAIYYGEPARCPTAMLSLFVVDQYLLEYPPFSHEFSRFFALSDLLVGAIQAEYAGIRAKIGLGELPAVQNRTALLDVLAVDATSDNSNLIALSLLHARYAQGPLELDSGSIASALKLSTRSLRRYTKMGIYLLQKHLTKAEQNAMRHNRLVQMTARVPGFNRTLVGRDHELSVLSNAIGQRGSKILVTGPAGIGKTHLVSHAIREVALNMLADHVVWAERPTSAEALMTLLYDEIMPQLVHVAVYEYVETHHAIIVIDGCESILSEINQTLTAVGNATFIFIARICTDKTLLARIDAHLTLDSLSQADAVRLYKSIDEWSNESKETPLTEVLKSGVPREIILAKRGIRSHPDEILANFTTLPSEAQNLILICALATHSTLHLSDLVAFDRDTLRYVETMQIAEWRDKDHLTMYKQIAERVFIYLEQPGGKPTCVQLGENLTRDTYGLLPRTALDVGQKLLHLLANTHDASIHSYQLIRAIWPHVLGLHRLHQWRQVVASFTERHGQNLPEPDRWWLLIAESKLMWRLGLYDESEAAAMKVVRESGHVGDFVTQQQALLQISEVRRRLGYFQHALNILERIEARPAKPTLKAESQHLQLKIQLEIGQVSAIEALLSEMDGHTNFDVELARCELHLLRKDFHESLVVAKSLLNGQRAESERGHVFALIARGYHYLGDMARADNFYQEALYCLQHSDNLFVVTRIYSNYAAMMIDAARYEEALELLEWLIAQQRLIQDRTGITASQHNLRYVRGLLLQR